MEFAARRSCLLLCHAMGSLWSLFGCSIFIPQVQIDDFDLIMSVPTTTCIPRSVRSHQSAPFLTVSPTDHRPSTVVVFATALILVLITLIIWTYIRFSFGGPWLADDTVSSVDEFIGGQELGN